LTGSHWHELARSADFASSINAISQIDQPLFASVFGSTTLTTPDLRVRWAVPVGH
jgi:hypothetical protein